jgi:hypothetical protein
MRQSKKWVRQIEKKAFVCLTALCKNFSCLFNLKKDFFYLGRIENQTLEKWEICLKEQKPDPCICQPVRFSLWMIFNLLL